MQTFTRIFSSKKFRSKKCSTKQIWGKVSQEFFIETVPSLNEYLDIPTFIRQGRPLSSSQVVES